MAEQLFRDTPSVELLQWLARGSLKQNLARAVRLWVWLRLLYGDESERLDLPDSFTEILHHSQQIEKPNPPTPFP